MMNRNSYSLFWQGSTGKEADNVIECRLVVFVKGARQWLLKKLS